MSYPPDRGERFDSDYHRRVLGHLPYPSDTYGWTPEALFSRMGPDVATDLQSVEELHGLLNELESQGHAERVPVNLESGPSVEVWRMTQQGLDALNAGLVNEPPPGAAPQGPAQVGMATPLSGATEIPAGYDTPNPTAQDIETSDPGPGAQPGPEGEPQQ